MPILKQLVVDTSVLVGELLRARGRELLGDSRIRLFAPDLVRDETAVEIPRRIAAIARSRALSAPVVEDLTAECFEAFDANITIVDRAGYSALEDEARARSLRDPGDWPVVACAIALDMAVWTNDNDFLGTGVPTWTTETLQSWLDRNPLG